MSKNIVLHIGLPKALSTYLQTFVFSEIENTYYEGRERDNFDLITRIIWDIMSRISPINFDTEKRKKELKEFLATIHEDNILISEEFLYGCYFNNFRDNKAILELLKSIFGDVKILVVIRRQDELVNSLYKHMLKIGFSVRFSKYINYKKGQLGNYSRTKNLNIDVKQINYYNYVRCCYNIFGEENVTVLPYEMYLEDRHKFLKNIFDHTGLPPYFPADNKMVNRSYSLLTSYLALLFNRFFVHRSNTLGFIPQRPFYNRLTKYQDKSKIVKLLKALSSRMTFKYLLTRIDKIYYKKYKFVTGDVKVKILENHRRDNEKLSKLLGLDLSRYKYH